MAAKIAVVGRKGTTSIEVKSEGSEEPEGGGDSVYIPRDANGNLIPLRKQTVNGQDIPLPAPAAETY